MKKLYICGMEIQVDRKKIKNMYIRVKKEGEIVVSAPVFLSDSAVESFVLSKQEWLKRAVDRVNAKQPLKRLYEDGEEIFFLGKKYVLRTDTARKGGYCFNGNELVIGVGEKSTVQSRRKALAEVYRDAMNQILPDIFDECQKNSGLYPKEWRVRDMTTRHGSCNTKEKRIWISLWLMEKPPECIKAVVYHELVHLKVKGHGKDFYDTLEKIYPEYSIVKKLLK